MHEIEACVMVVLILFTATATFVNVISNDLNQCPRCSQLLKQIIVVLVDAIVFHTMSGESLVHKSL